MPGSFTFALSLRMSRTGQAATGHPRPRTRSPTPIPPDPIRRHRGRLRGLERGRSGARARGRNPSRLGRVTRSLCAPERDATGRAAVYQRNCSVPGAGGPCASSPARPSGSRWSARRLRHMHLAPVEQLPRAVLAEEPEARRAGSGEREQQKGGRKNGYHRAPSKDGRAQRRTRKRSGRHEPRAGQPLAATPRWRRGSLDQVCRRLVLIRSRRSRAPPRSRAIPCM